MTIEQAAEMLGVQPGLLQAFAVADPFHDGLPLEGFLCQRIARLMALPLRSSG